MKIAGAIQEYLLVRKNALTHKTFQWYEWMLLHSFLPWCTEQGVFELTEITAVRVQQFVSANLEDSDNTRHHKAQVVKGFLRWCSRDEDMGVRAKVIDRIEMPKVEQPEVEIFSSQEIQLLLNACDKTRYPLRNKAMIYVLFDTGVRSSEVCYDGSRPEEKTGLRFEDVVMGTRKGSESYIIVMGKGRKSRTVKFGDETKLALQRYLNRERPRAKSDYFFLSQGDDRGPVSVSTLHDLLTRLGELSGVEHVHAHRFRHTFAINQLLAGTSSLVLMELMGHDSLESTKIYTRALTQMQARQASVSVVDLWKAAPKATRDAIIREAIQRDKDKK